MTILIKYEPAMIETAIYRLLIGSNIVNNLSRLSDIIVTVVHYPIFKFGIRRCCCTYTCMDVRDTWRHIGAIENYDRAAFSRSRDRSAKIKAPLVRTCELVE